MNDNVETSWSLKKGFIIDDIDIRIESLKSDLDNLREEMLKEVDREYDAQMCDHAQDLTWSVVFRLSSFIQ